MKKTVSLALILSLLLSLLLIPTYATAEKTVLKVDFNIDLSKNSSEHVNALSIYNICDNWASYTYQSGDKLVYDVMISHDKNGLGVLEAELEGNPTCLRDVKPIYEHQFTDAVNQWKTVTMNLLGKITNLYVFLWTGTCDIATLSAMFDNIRIERADGTVALSIFSSAHLAPSANISKVACTNQNGVWEGRPFTFTVSSASVEAPEADNANKKTVLKADFNIDLSKNSSEHVNALSIYNICDNWASYTYQSGDKLVYDVMISHDKNGLGILEADLEGTTTCLREVKPIYEYQFTDAVNQWKTVTMNLPGKITNLYVFLWTGTCDIATLSAMFDNIRIERADGTVALSIFSSDNTTAASDVAKVACTNQNGVWDNRPFTFTLSAGVLLVDAPENDDNTGDASNDNTTDNTIGNNTNTSDATVAVISLTVSILVASAVIGKNRSH